MTPLTANLKHFYQCKTLLLMEGFMALMCAPIFFTAFDLSRVTKQPIIDANKAFFFCFPLGILFMAIFFIAGVQRQILSKPFTFCLPTHRPLPKRLLTWVACIFSFLFSLPVLLGLSMQPAVISWPEIIAQWGAQFSIELCVAAVTIFTVFATKRANELIGFFYFIMIGLYWIGFPDFIANAIFFHPIPTIAVCIAVLAAFWRWMDGTRLARENCGQFYLGVTSAWNRAARERAIREKTSGVNMSSKTLAQGAERFFLKRMNQTQFLSAARAIWGGIYETVGSRILPTLPATIGMYTVLMIIFGYWGSSYANMQNPSFRFPMQDMLFLMPLFWVALDAAPRQTALLFPEGRRVRFLRSLTLGFVLTGVALGMCFLFLGISRVLLPWMPTLDFRGTPLHYQALHGFGWIWVPTLAPLALLAFTLFRKKNTLVPWLLFMLAMMPCMFWLPLSEKAQTVSGLICFLAASVLSFCLWIAVLTWRTQRGDLL